MASEHANNASPAGAEASTFTLSIISPSSGVPPGLAFSDLPLNTTVMQLKERIRDSLETKPSHQVQRLIHRGRLLSRDNETMLEVFGEQTLRSPDGKMLHLVLRELSDSNHANIPAPPVSQAAAPSQSILGARFNPQPPQLPQLAPGHIHSQHLFHAQPQGPQGRPVATWPNASFGPQPPVVGMTANGSPVNVPLGLNPQQLAHQQRQWAAAQMEHHNRLQELINHNQRERAAMGLNGAQDSHAPTPHGVAGSHTPGRTVSPFQPDATRTVVREGVGPNGQQWRITVNETVSTPQGFHRNSRTGSPFSAVNVQNPWSPPHGTPPPRSVPSGGQLSGADVQNMLRNADANQAATRVMADAMRRNTSTSSLTNLSNNPAHQPIPPGVTTPMVPSRTGSATGTPDPLRAASQSSNPPTSHPQAQPTSGTPEVYILSSPEGPRALLVHGNLGTYYTPPNPPTARYPVLQRPFPFGAQFNMPLPPFQPQPVQPQHRSPVGDMWAAPPPTANAAQQNQAQAQAPGPQGLPPLPPAQLQHGHAIAQHGNPHVRAIALAQIWPHIWMVMRLTLFIWWFTSPNSSWSRWFTVISIAVTLFLFNAGALTPIAEHVWNPIRRHLEHLMPLADNHGRNAPPARAENARDANGNQQPPRPETIADRLVQQRRQANANWLMTQARRLERAGILFLASIAPGVAERHIAQLEAEARAERQRLEAAEAEAAAAEEAARAHAENGEAAEGATAQEGTNAAPPGTESSNETRPAEREGGGNTRPQDAEEPLIAV
ncbi:uncharacterized protein BCR38DRAFT_22767 [Pseudomassariella vexata]|uniref:Ubiquitin-like domain-containing protein n=1 Tax=Pseudomassariella vexata TaxID=1141098 RepID=A0A1Y2EK06_9PEZI|nr:uncharacterized protein BCR38DRAFT_22767 [Pseudomassariella vexata]ORY71893.1 hypothetical protein BCR38DRAFT_22767 [Pseudomassariella vexata]